MDKNEGGDEIFWICRRNFLDLSTKFFGFVDEIFWICRQNFLDLSTKCFGFFDNFFGFFGESFGFSTIYCNVAWVTRPERPKGAKDDVKQARRAQSRPEGPQARSRGPEGP